MHYSAQKDQWRLRFASLDDEDRYGGSVTLDGANREMQGLHDGMMARVEGGLVDVDSRQPSPLYHVRDIASVGK